MVARLDRLIRGTQQFLGVALTHCWPTADAAGATAPRPSRDPRQRESDRSIPVRPERDEFAARFAIPQHTVRATLKRPAAGASISRRRISRPCPRWRPGGCRYRMEDR